MTAINAKRNSKEAGRQSRRYRNRDNGVEQYDVLAEATGVIDVGGCVACYLHLVLGVSSTSHRCERSAV